MSRLIGGLGLKSRLLGLLITRLLGLLITRLRLLLIALLGLLKPLLWLLNPLLGGITLESPPTGIASGGISRLRAVSLALSFIVFILIHYSSLSAGSLHPGILWRESLSGFDNDSI